MMDYVKEYKKLKKKPPEIIGFSSMLEADKIYKDLIFRGVIEKTEPLVTTRRDPVECTISHN